MSRKEKREQRQRASTREFLIIVRLREEKESERFEDFDGERWIMPEE